MANSVRFLANVAVCIVMGVVACFLFTGYTALRVPASALFGGVAMSENISQPLSREKLCDFLSQLQVDLGDKGKCLVESPVVEKDVCYTSSNHLAYYALRYVCGNYDLANAVLKFLQSYPTDFYDYHQILVGKPFTLPFTTIENVQVDVVNNIRIVHVRRTTSEISDYYRYVNLLVYKALYHLFYGERDKCLAELGKLEGLWDGKGFADAYYQQNQKYETYKIALALYTYKALAHRENIDKYTSKLISINPFTTLYTDNAGEGDLNLETASITLLALYTIPPINAPIPKTATEQTPPTTLPTTIPTAIAIAVTLLIIGIAIRYLVKKR
jgi:hypothetical protein